MTPELTPQEITETQKLNALAFKYYQGANWSPKAGDYYTSTRADLELYQVVEVTETAVKTRYCDPERGSEISEWPVSSFLNDGFGTQRVWVPDWIFTLLPNENHKAEIQAYKDVIALKDEYIQLLTDELSDMAGMAYVHGWRSTRVEKGQELRDKISQFKL